jgi:catechol 2,3-dioxygenase-like lactoylglutathione lyase family enzyme
LRIVGVDHVQLRDAGRRRGQGAGLLRRLAGRAGGAEARDLAKRGGVWFESPQVKIHLGVEAEFRPARKAHPALLVDGLAELVATLRAAGCDVVEEPLAGRPRAYVNDPFGNRLELIERP